MPPVVVEALESLGVKDVCYLHKSLAKQQDGCEDRSIQARVESNQLSIGAASVARYGQFMRQPDALSLGALDLSHLQTIADEQ